MAKKKTVKKTAKKTTKKNPRKSIKKVDLKTSSSFRTIGVQIEEEVFREARDHFINRRLGVPHIQNIEEEVMGLILQGIEGGNTGVIIQRRTPGPVPRKR